MGVWVGIMLFGQKSMFMQEKGLLCQKENYLNRIIKIYDLITLSSFRDFPGGWGEMLEKHKSIKPAVLMFNSKQQNKKKPSSTCTMEIHANFQSIID